MKFDTEELYWVWYDKKREEDLLRQFGEDDNPKK